MILLLLFGTLNSFLLSHRTEVFGFVVFVGAVVIAGLFLFVSMIRAIARE